jgi:hypothetical protein
MGTSVSQQSPVTLNWSTVRALYDADAISVSRVAQEVWRAATNQVVGNLAEDLAAPLVARCFKLASESTSVGDAISTVRRTAALSGESSLAVDLAQRAIVSAFQTKRDRASALVESFFSEACNYLVSRDLSGHVGSSERTSSVSATAEFKANICNQVSKAVAELPRKDTIFDSGSAWRSYVKGVVAELQRPR